MQKVHLDFETRSMEDVKTVGAWRYATDPSTSVLCLCYREAGAEEVRTITKEEFEYYESGLFDFMSYDNDNIEHLIGLARNPYIRFVAHNSMFEYCIWNEILYKKLGFPPLNDFDRWECTASKAAAHALPRSLGECTHALHLSEEKDETGKRIMLQLSKPRKPSKTDPSIWCNDAGKFQTLYKYCAQDVVVEQAIDEALPSLSPFERKIWKLDQEINSRGVRIDTQALDIAISFTERFKTKLNKELCELTEGQVNKATEVAKLTRYLRNFVDEKELPSLNAAIVTEFLKTCEDKKIKRLLEIRQQAGKSSTSKLDRIKECMCFDNKVRNILVYHGTSTGRWAGSGIQVQNFPRGNKKYDIDSVIEVLKLNNYDAFCMIYPNVVDAISAALRGFLIADEGGDLIAADFSAIEARVVFWLSGAERGLKAFRNNEDIYCEFASEIYKRKITKADKDERQLGKTGVLGCGFQMGAKRFKAQVKTLTGLDISEETAKLIVDTYRTTYPEVVAFWYLQEQAAVKAVKERGKTITAGPVKWMVYGQFLYCRLPSGRLIAYADPQTAPIETSWGEIKEQLTFMAVNATTKKWERQHTYGGSLTENIVQGTARDLMAYGMLNLEKAGYKIKWTVHDEVIASVPKDEGNVKEFETLLAATPDWAKGCPVKAEGWRGVRYRK